MIKICNILFRFFGFGALVFIASYYAMGKNDTELINVGLILLGTTFFVKIVELNIRKKNYKSK